MFPVVRSRRGCGRPCRCLWRPACGGPAASRFFISVSPSSRRSHRELRIGPGIARQVIAIARVGDARGIVEPIQQKGRISAACRRKQRLVERVCCCHGDEQSTCGITAGCGNQLSRCTLPGTSAILADIVAHIHQEAIGSVANSVIMRVVEFDIRRAERAEADIDQRLVVVLGEGRDRVRCPRRARSLQDTGSAWIERRAPLEGERLWIEQQVTDARPRRIRRAGRRMANRAEERV